MSAPPKVVLAVEDNAIAREGLGVVLGRAGYRALLAANGEEALALLRGGARPDLILLDMLMPALDGWHFLERLQRWGQKPSVPIVVTATNLTREWAEDHGCQGFLRKPVDAEDLLQEVRRCLGQEG